VIELLTIGLALLADLRRSGDARTVAQLRAQLRGAGLAVGGDKARLEDRLARYLALRSELDGMSVEQIMARWRKKELYQLTRAVGMSGLSWLDKRGLAIVLHRHASRELEGREPTQHPRYVIMVNDPVTGHLVTHAGTYGHARAREVMARIKQRDGGLLTGWALRDAVGAPLGMSGEGVTWLERQRRAQQIYNSMQGPALSGDVWELNVLEHRMNEALQGDEPAFVLDSGSPTESQKSSAAQPQTKPPPEAIDKAHEMLSQYEGRHQVCGISTVLQGWWIEIHTLGCRNAADEPEENWMASHWAIYDEYSNDSISTVIGTPDDGDNFVSITPQLSLVPEPPLINWDDDEGLGRVSDCANVDYLGFVTKMTAQEFLNLNPARRRPPHPSIVQALEDHAPMGRPFVSADEEDGYWQVRSHEGRARAMAISQLFGPETTIEVCVFPRGGTRRRHLTDAQLHWPLVADPRRDRP